MPVLNPNDASILALIAQYPKTAVSKRKQLEHLLGDEGKRVAAAMYLNAQSGGKRAKKNAESPIEAQTADLLRNWARGNRHSTSRPRKTVFPKKFGGTTYAIKMGDNRDWNIVVGEKPRPAVVREGRKSASRGKSNRKTSQAK